MAAKLKILVINGPNLNMLGKREPDKYGSHSLEHIMSDLNNAANSLDVTLTHFQSNSEQALIERIHDAWQAVDYIIINPAAFTHTSVALRDALLSVDIPFFEVHLSNVHARETFRHHSYFSDVAQGVICGLGAMGYHAALHAAVSRLQNSN
ncbi:MAG: type II 3-dehydroquinate dehydratase [Pseudoalteromonas tetraodonis]|jgi:3-dehydroquinate dehydratase-2|uniref:type II 3-dehydroquinate dehydratase n=1 Tax=Pseudoalteromonas TaxID=53246 RepID=UPI0004530698|nr:MULTISPECIES: type II 3-dehydroquinate dehydratase [Pseudoalteromonas]EWS98902.1 3-dehydroquinate dehydratase [Pseudoalteromonas sp. SCSIO_11900]MCK8103583.1 type II 3-dehydroquinate dehydratase [Pseudoalteromonas sp. 2CM36K]MCK8134934.1 type II 3-dehydroquinate dehydratase [Pseudoalteromonas sp. 2CM28B]MDX1360586.1 type II 3-dehydroquinate dehydratase [Pseudoalteromonas tetraodonis]ODS13587.1 type II 3-dehydroquinate dehydratase [Pseudoalteromonas tetraodonis]